MRKRQNYGGLDVFRLCAALLVIAIHTSPLASVSGAADFFLTRILARVAVPFFLMVTGQFVITGLLNPSVKSIAKYHKYLLKTALLYLFCILIYLPIGIYAGIIRNLLSLPHCVCFYLMARFIIYGIFPHASWAFYWFV